MANLAKQRALSAQSCPEPSDKVPAVAGDGASSP